uniref:Probable molybdopterin-synthase adenylyltransferase n=1 Tax=Sporolithon durum TaxID=48970 RepID=A0A141SD54_9FLOR|nr:molybdopterin biosynthesis protein [Sporolithon durum]AMK96222.1 molybdopterin biosynthesis protein [Sporolithon durum]
MLNSTELCKNKLSEYEYNVYARQIILDKLGMKGQKRIKASKVLCIGAGGLNCSTILYLSGAGIGTIGIIDNDKIEISNLQRQILYRKKDIKKPKVVAAKNASMSLNPLCKINIYNKHLDKHNAFDIIINYDIIIDGTDNIESRYIISEACQKLHKIHIYGAVENLEGQISVFNYQGGPTYETLYPKETINRINSCNQQGILGPLPGIIGLLQAIETLKIITGIGNILNGEILVYNLANASFKKIKIRRPKMTKKIFNDLIKKRAITKQLNLNINKHISKITFKKIQSNYKIIIIDIREPIEFKLYHLKNSINIPLKTINRINTISYLKSLSEQKIIVIYCYNGSRSSTASEILETHQIKHYILKEKIKEIKN